MYDHMFVVYSLQHFPFFSVALEGMDRRQSTQKIILYFVTKEKCMIYRGLGFLAVIWLIPPPPPISKLPPPLPSVSQTGEAQ
jgi:hypothetical protein